MSAERVPGRARPGHGSRLDPTARHRRDDHLDVGVESLAGIIGCPLNPVGHPGRFLRPFLIKSLPTATGANSTNIICQQALRHHA